ncbi:hypothetical protein [Kribbella sp. NPDC023855]|uniref:hypothetical protein n=1 Tax=Kribbella sp. NPDC023855 TaxID=3154698 RepID=UPI0033CC19FA
MQLGEVEVAGGNYAAGRPVTASSSAEYLDNGWRRAALTDGITRSALGYSMGFSTEALPMGTPASVGVDLGDLRRSAR